jgi:LPXTG-motif cell wall-anchored protein
MHRILAGLIAVILAAAVGVAIVRIDEEATPSAQGTGGPTPKQTYTFNGPPPTVPTETETPIVPASTGPDASPTETVGSLANTGSSSTTAIALTMLALALAAGTLVRRAVPPKH